jgi:hypothetical protein
MFEDIFDWFKDEAIEGMKEGCTPDLAERLPETLPMRESLACYSSCSLL